MSVGGSHARQPTAQNIVRSSQRALPEASQHAPFVDLNYGSHPVPLIEMLRRPLGGSVIDRLQVSSSVNVSVPGRYSVVYTAVSLDGTQTAEAVLSVTVTGGDK